MSSAHPLPPATITRRGLLCAFGVAAGAIAVGGGTAAVAAGGRAADPLRRSAWSSLVGHRVVVGTGVARRAARVVAVTDLGIEGSPVRSACAGREDAFAVVLAVAGADLAGATATVHHPGHGPVPLFLTGGSRSAGTRRYVATIDRRTTA